MSSDNCQRNSVSSNFPRSGYDQDEDAHISKKRRVSSAEPDWQAQLQQALGRASVEHSQLQKGVSRDHPVNQNIISENSLCPHPQWLPQEPAAVETGRMRRTLSSTTAPSSIESYRQSHLRTPAYDQPGRAISNILGAMAQSAYLVPSQNASSLNSPANVEEIAALNQSGRYDYDFQALAVNYHEPLNFTAVEIIAFLPMLYCNSSIARRFVNNGIENPIHAEIAEAHHIYPRPVLEIGREYYNALRPSAWSTMPKEEIAKMWSRKNHRKPSDWDATNISMNEFVPDRIIKEGVSAPTPTSVPFRVLMHGIKQIPTDNDAADLTRAIQFANSDQAKNMFPGRDLMFPDDLVDILGTIGPTLITQQHRDKEIVKRYRKLYEAKKKLKKSSRAGNTRTGQHSSDRTLSQSGHDPDSSVPPENPLPLLGSSPEASPRRSETRLSSVSHSPHSAEQSKHGSMLQSPITDIPPKYPSEQQVQNLPTEYLLTIGMNRSNKLLRDLDPSLPLHSDDPVTIAQLILAIRFARRPDQKEIDWRDRVEDIFQICAMLQADREIGMIPSDDQAWYERGWEQWLGERQRALDNSMAALQEELGVHVSLPSRFTAEDYEDLFGEPAPEYLSTPEHFQYYDDVFGFSDDDAMQNASA
ncbi:hypothetical protein PMIN06_005060 [Paraphaeosphaeria minitans]|uniref:Uncharacterized protein n=1 Tax=Paraphaeosphaeria minitans TaxID=565426 RepID=A0A9P6G829_9PLEO|nr:hypothetical protein PMIN01_10809 [Paraphaeosphaeria minitans]